MAGTQNIARMSPRQRMINLMYIVLTAMLALNVSTDVLNGFKQVQEGLFRTNSNHMEYNAYIVKLIAEVNKQNPNKGAHALELANNVRQATKTLYSEIDSLKLAIAVCADGVGADVRNIQNQENLDAASIIMLDPITNRGTQLRHKVDAYRTYLSKVVSDTTEFHNIAVALNTKNTYVNPANEGVVKSWEETMFDGMPVMAAVTLLTKVQSDLLYAEGQALNHILYYLDAADVKVNKLDAFVIPHSHMVMRGTRYSADIVLAAVDTTALPRVFVNGKMINGNKYEFVAGSTGEFNYSGYIELPHEDGTVSKHPFKSDYIVFDPVATVSPTMMNVLYCGIDNPISIAVPGVAPQAISASMTNGTLSKSGDHWVARPTKVGTEAVISVSANVDGHSTPVGSMKLRVRKLPDPSPFIKVGDNMFKNGRLAKGSILSASGISAAIDDGLLNIPFMVTSFDTVFFDSMGNAMPEKSAGSNFSSRQMDKFRSLQRGKRFYITNIHAIGPDKVERVISPMEVIVN